MNKLLAYLVLILCISFSACSPDATALNEDETVEMFNSVFDLHEKVEKILQEIRSEMTDIEAISQQVTKWLKTLTDVKDVYSKDNEIRIVHSNGMESYILLLDNDSDENNLTRSNTQTAINEQIIDIIRTKAGVSEDNIIRNKDVLIWSPFGHISEETAIKNALGNSKINFRFDCPPSDKCDINSLNNLTKYGIVLLCTDGLESAKGFLTSQSVKREIPKEERDWFKKQGLTIGSRYNHYNGVTKKYWAILPNFITQLQGDFPKSVIFNSSCYSASTTKLYDAFNKKGAKTYLGFSDEIYALESSKKISDFFTILTQPDPLFSGFSNKTEDAYKSSSPTYYSTNGRIAEYRMFGSPEMRFEIEQQPIDGVLINGVIWANQNLGASSPYDQGLLYQWNRNKGWSLPNPLPPFSWQGYFVDGWDTSIPDGDTWTNDPCPSGWRIPTVDEIAKLYNAGSTWTTTPVKGRICGSGNNTIFLPAGYFYGSNGYLNTMNATYPDMNGAIYWANPGTGVPAGTARTLQITYDSLGGGSRPRDWGCSVRCVRE